MLVKRALPWLGVLCLGTLLGGLWSCYDPKYEPGQVACGPDLSCPEGYFCQADRRCYPEGTGPDTGDMSVPPPRDMSRRDSAGPQPDLISVYGPLHTRRGDIVDEAGQVVRLRGISWTGFDIMELKPRVPMGKSVGAILDQLRSLGFNTIRIPFISKLVDDPAALGRLEALVTEAGMRKMWVILARQGPTSGLWYDGMNLETKWVADWRALVDKFKANPTVAGVDLHIEPHGPATWGSGVAATDWRMAAENLGNQLLQINSKLLIIVEGLDIVDGESYWWGGNLRGAQARPVAFSVPNQLVYGTNDYSPSVVPMQSWFMGAEFATRLPDKWRSVWGYLPTMGIAPVMVVGFGWESDPKAEKAADEKWRPALRDYLNKNGISFAFWRLDDDATYASLLKMDGAIEKSVSDQLEPLLSP